jgi:hypothetical protein
MVWVLVASSIYFLNCSEWTVIVGILMSASQIQYRNFGNIKQKEENAN